MTHRGWYKVDSLTSFSCCSHIHFGEFVNYVLIPFSAKLFTQFEGPLKVTTSEVKTVHGHMLPPLLHVCNRLASHADAACPMYCEIYEVICCMAAPVWRQFGFLSYPASLSPVHFRSKCNQFFCWWYTLQVVITMLRFHQNPFISFLFAKEKKMLTLARDRTVIETAGQWKHNSLCHA